MTHSRDHGLKESQQNVIRSCMKKKKNEVDNCNRGMNECLTTLAEEVGLLSPFGGGPFLMAVTSDSRGNCDCPISPLPKDSKPPRYSQF